MPTQSSLQGLRIAVPYIRAYKGRVFVVKLGGHLCRPGRILDDLVDQMALLYQVGIQMVVVHGGGEQASALGKRLGVEPQVLAGRRITDDETLEVVKMAFAGTVNTDLVAAFRRAEIPALGLSGVDGGLITVRKRPPRSVMNPASGESRVIDFGHVGDISEVRVDGLHHLLSGGYVPVVCSLAAGTDGGVMNVNADTIAARIAVATGAAKYFLVTDVDGVLGDVRDPLTLKPYLDLEQLEVLIREGAVSGGMQPKLAACTVALEGGVPRVHIVNGTEPDTLLSEVFTNEGCGTLLVKRCETGSQEAQWPAVAP